MTHIKIIIIAIGLLVGCQPTEQSEMANQQQGAIKVTIMYPNAEGKTFDMAYYSSKHMPMLAELFGDKMTSYQIDEGIAGRTPDDQIPFLAIGYMYFDKLSDYQEVFAPNRETILNDIPNYTNIRPIVQISNVVK